MSPTHAYVQIEPVGNYLTNAATGEVIPLAMQQLLMAGRVTPAGAMLRVTHRFKCEGTNPMEALYTFMLPRDGTLRRFVVKGEDFEVESKLEPRKEARKQYEDGMQAGHLSVLAETNPDGMISLSVGQVKPDEEISVIMDIVSGVDAKNRSYRFRFPFTLAPSYHPQAKGTATADGAKIQLPSDVFGDIILPEWKDDASGLHQVSFRLHVEAAGSLDSVSSPSHRILVRPNSDGSAEIELSGTSDVPNRDLVVDVAAKEMAPTVFADDVLITKKTDKDDPKIPKGAPRWTAVIPSSLVPKAVDAPRKVCFVLDRSGSMQGLPLERAKVAMNACLSALQPTDTFGMLHFGSDSKKFDAKMAVASDANRRRAFDWLKRIQANGGTELSSALGDAVEILDGPGGDIFLLTDGEVFGTGNIIEQCGLAGTRVHVLGIGSASQDRFLAALARRSGGVERMVGMNEDVAATAMELFNAVRQPVQVKVKASVKMKGKKSQEMDVGTIWDGYAVLVSDNGTTGDSLPQKITLSWDKDKVDVTLGTTQAVPNGLCGLLWAGRRVEDLESALDTATKDGPMYKSIEKDLADISTVYGLASRVMSLVSVVHRAGDQAGVQPEQKVVAVGTPEGMVSQGMAGLRSVAQVLFCSAPTLGGSHTTYAASGMSFGGATKGLVSSLRSRSAAPTKMSFMDSFDGDSDEETYGCSLNDGSITTCDTNMLMEPPRSLNFIVNEQMGVGVINPNFGRINVVTTSMDLFDHLIQLQADGGLPGSDELDRVVKTAILALAAYMADKDGNVTVYHLHIQRMLGFIKAYLAKKGGTGHPDLTRLVSIVEAGALRVAGPWSMTINGLMSGKVKMLDSWEKVTDALKNI